MDREKTLQEIQKNIVLFIITGIVLSGLVTIGVQSISNRLEIGHIRENIKTVSEDQAEIQKLFYKIEAGLLSNEGVPKTKPPQGSNGEGANEKGVRIIEAIITNPFLPGICGVIVFGLYLGFYFWLRAIAAKEERPLSQKQRLAIVVGYLSTLVHWQVKKETAELYSILSSLHREIHDVTQSMDELKKSTEKQSMDELKKSTEKQSMDELKKSTEKQSIDALKENPETKLLLEKMEKMLEGAEGEILEAALEPLGEMFEAAEEAEAAAAEEEAEEEPQEQ